MNEIVLRGAHVISMDPAIGDLPSGDVHIDDGLIRAVAPHVDAPNAVIFDARGTIAIPGLVDTHDHLWGTLLRGLIGDSGAESWFPQKGRLGPYFTPADQHVGVRLALAEALAGGVTTVHNWAHNINAPADADANLRAHAEIPLRARFSYGTPSTHPGLSLTEMASVMGRVGRPVDAPMDLDDLARLVGEHARAVASGMLQIGAALRGPSRSPTAVYRQEFETARRLGVPITMHCAGTREEVARIRQCEILGAEGLLGPDLELVHCNWLNAGERELVAKNGVKVSITPVSELRLAMGMPQLSELIDAGVNVSLGFDTTPISGSADMFSTMRTAFNLERIRTGRVIPSQQILELATLGGARALGLDHITGSLTPGKRADVVLVRTDTLGMAPSAGADPAAALVHSAHPADVDTVIVDGRVLKRGGELVSIDAAAIVAEAAMAQWRLLARADEKGRTVAEAVGTAVR